MDQNEEQDICSICFEDFINNDDYTLECNHKFHTNCILKWFRNDNSTCPLCKDSHTYNNLSYYTKIDTIPEIKKLGRKKSCPPEIRKILDKIKKQKEQEKKYKEKFKEFKTKYKKEILEYNNLKKDRYKYKRNIRRLERNLTSYITVSPIYIKK